MSIDVFKTGFYDYSERGYEKPVYYDEEALLDAIKNTNFVKLTSEHENEAIGSIGKFYVEDGVLKAKQHAKAKDFDLKDFSPLFSFDPIYEEDYIRPSNIRLKSVGVTNNPRNQIFPNNDLHSDNMSNNDNTETIDKLIDSNSKKDVRIKELESIIDDNRSKLDKIDKLEEKLNQLTSQNQELNEQIKDYAPKAKAFDNSYEEKRQGLLNELFGDKEENHAPFKDFNLEQLESLKENRIVNQPPKGVGAKEAEGLGETEPKPDENEYNTFSEDYEAAFGEKPKFVQ